MIGNYFWGGAAAPYEIEQSLRFDGSSYLTFYPSADGNLQSWSWSMWVKYSGVNDTYGTICGKAASGSRRHFTQFSSNTLASQQYTGASYTWQESSLSLYRDPSAWMHFLWVWDSTNTTNTDRSRWYINGSRVETSLSNDVALNQASYVNSSTNGFCLGARAVGGYDRNLNGYIAECHFVDGSALNPTDFGEYDDNGVWRPIAYSGSYGTNGSYLKFDPSATNGVGHDHSGNGNNFTPSGFTTSGTGTDVMSDTPTTNWCTLNPLSLRASYNNDCNDGNLGIEAVGGNWDRGTKGTIGASSGKWYWEYTHGTIASGYPQADIGVTKYASEINHYNNGGSGSSDTYLIQGNNGNKYTNGSGSSYGSSFTTGDTCNIALDLDNGKVWFGKNGTWFNSGDPAAGTNEAFSGLSGTFWPLFYWGISAGTSGINQAYFNFGQRAFEYTVPTGFLPLNTSNLPAPDIADGSDNFQTDLDTGANILSSAQGIFSNGLWWIKDRANANQHQILNSTGLSTNAVRLPSTTPAAYSAPAGNSVAWCWALPAASTANTDGTISSDCWVNHDAGFSLVSYDGTSAVNNVGHDLDRAPEFIIYTRPANTADCRSLVYHKSMGPGNYMFLNYSNAQAADSAMFGNTDPDANVFYLGTPSSHTNTTGQTYQALCWHSVPGFSAFGSYPSNGSVDGPFIYTGFRIQWLLLKSTAASDWILLDADLNTYNPTTNVIYASMTRAEQAVGSAANVDFLSNGFKLRYNWGGTNTPTPSGQKYIYAAFAEHPFGGSGVSPATAR